MPSNDFNNEAFRRKKVEIVMVYADIEVPARKGCRFLRLSHGVAARLLQQGHVGIQDLDRAKRLLVLTDAADRIVTVVKCDPQRRTRAPKHGWGAR
jgi:hypothetical protein